MHEIAAMSEIAVMFEPAVMSEIVNTLKNLTMVMSR
jgi:hypothetical protein